MLIRIRKTQKNSTHTHTSQALEDQNRERLSVGDKDSERKQRLQDSTGGRRQKEGHS